MLYLSVRRSVAPDPEGSWAVFWIVNCMRTTAWNSDTLTRTRFVGDPIQDDSWSALGVMTILFFITYWYCVDSGKEMSKNAIRF